MNRGPFQPDVKTKAACPVLNDYGIIGIPTTVLIDRQGRVVGQFRPWSKPDAGVLERLLNEKER